MRKKITEGERLARRRESSRRYREANPERVRETSRRYREANLDKEKKRRRRYREENLEKVKESERRYREANPGMQKENSRRWWRANPEKVKESNRRYYEKNAEKVKERSRRWYEENTEKARGNNRRWLEKNQERARGGIRRWQKENPEKKKEYYHKRRAQKVASGGSFTASEWRALCSTHGGRCLGCGTGGKLTVDHVVPISRGGRNDVRNLQPLCKSCNSSKGARTIDYRLPCPETTRPGTWRAKQIEMFK